MRKFKVGDEVIIKSLCVNNKGIVVNTCCGGEYYVVEYSGCSGVFRDTHLTLISDPTKMKTKISRLFKDLLSNPNFNPLEVKGRRLGKSLGLSFKYISEAMLNPETSVKIVDHYGTRDADTNLFRSTWDLIHKLKLEGFTSHHGHQTITYNPYIIIQSKTTTVWKEVSDE